jgi:HlyD family secretion protein
MIRLTLGAILIAATMGAALSSNEGSGRTGTPGNRDYLTTEVTNGTIRRSITAIGALQAVTTIEVSSQLSGQIARLSVDFNDPVNAGQELATLDQRGFEAHVAQAEAEVQMAHENVAILAATLDKARGVEDETAARRRVFAARTDRARIGLEAAERQLDRSEQLSARGTATRAAVEDAVSARDTAAADLREAEALAAAHEHLVASSEAGRRQVDAEFANAKAALPLRNAALALARLDLERSTIRAPIDGIVVGRNVEPGQTVAVSLDAPVLFTIAGDLAAMEIHANIDETDIGEIVTGQAAEFTVDAFPNRTFAATVIEIRKVARLIQGVVTYTVVLETENPDGLLLPGMTSIVRIVVEETGSELTVPLTALRFDGNGTILAGDTIWVLSDDGGIVPRRVTLGLDDGTDVAVLGGDLAAGERVVTGRVPRPTGRRIFGISY